MSKQRPSKPPPLTFDHSLYRGKLTPRQEEIVKTILDVSRGRFETAYAKGHVDSYNSYFLRVPLKPFPSVLGIRWSTLRAHIIAIGKAAPLLWYYQYHDNSALPRWNELVSAEAIYAQTSEEIEARSKEGIAFRLWKFTDSTDRMRLDVEFTLRGSPKDITEEARVLQDFILECPTFAKYAAESED